MVNRNPEDALDAAFESLKADLASGGLDLKSEAAQAVLDSLPPELRTTLDEVTQNLDERDEQLRVPRPDDAQLERNMIVYNNMPEDQRNVLKHAYETQLACGMVISGTMPNFDPKAIANETAKVMTAMLYIILKQAEELQNIQRDTV